jgi:hypothetical protein
MELDSGALLTTLGKLAENHPVLLVFSVAWIVTLIMLPAILKEVRPMLIEWKKLTIKQQDNAAKTRNATSDSNSKLSRQPRITRID